MAMFREAIGHFPLGRRIFKGFGKTGNTIDSSEAMRAFFQSRLSGDFQSFVRQNDSAENTGESGAVTKVRALFISDIHLGTRSCRADMILDFLKKYEAETLYLVGDIIDGWRLKKTWHWPLLHEEVLRVIMGKAARGTRVVYIPGNHDDFLHAAQKSTGVEITETAIHTTADGKRFLVMHGDQLDEVIRNVPWLAYVGDVAYDALTVFNCIYNKITKSLGFEYRSISALAKRSVKRVVNFIGKFEEALVTTGRNHDVDGVICGHIHHATMRKVEKMHYVNTGDWVENCTAVAENTNGVMELIHHRIG